MDDFPADDFQRNPHNGGQQRVAAGHARTDGSFATPKVFDFGRTHRTMLRGTESGFHLVDTDRAGRVEQEYQTADEGSCNRGEQARITTF